MSRKRKIANRDRDPTQAGAGSRGAEVRIIGGEFRGRRLHYHGDAVVRPMKHRTREAIFNLVSTECTGRHAVDLFAGTGALGLEALSRGATCATFIEKHVPSARVVEENIHMLGVESRSTLLVTSAFLWAKRDLPSHSRVIGQTSVSSDSATDTTRPWLVFCSPPYAFYTERRAEMLELVRRIQEHAPPGSILIVESDQQFDFQQFGADSARADWNTRTYPPAVIGIWRS